MPVHDVLLVLAGVCFVGMGLIDAFLTIFLPHRGGPLSRRLARAIWLGSVQLVLRAPRVQGAAFAFAGPLMLLATILVWMGFVVLGFALLTWPFLDEAFLLAPALGAPGFVDALYYSGVTFTTVGYGDITPLHAVWQVLALVEGAAGFALISASIAYLLTIFRGLDQRDGMASRIYAETGGTWSGVRFVATTLEEEGLPVLRTRIETWAELTRRLQQRIHRFQPLALYLGARGARRDPEKMLQALAEATLAARVAAQAQGARLLRPSAGHLELAFDSFARTVLRHHGHGASLERFERADPDGSDRDEVKRVWDLLAPLLDEPGAPWGGEPPRELMRLACRIRSFIEELDRITRWRDVEAVRRGT